MYRAQASVGTDEGQDHTKRPHAILCMPCNYCPQPKETETVCQKTVYHNEMMGRVQVMACADQEQCRTSRPHVPLSII